MTRFLAFIFWTTLLLGNSFAQRNQLFTSLEDALKVHPDSVYRLDLSRKSLQTVPNELLRFSNLEELNLSKNKLKSLPEGFVFDHLEVLNLSKNRFTEFPTTLCKNKGLKQLFMGKNKISKIPTCISHLTNLVILDLWYNTISEIPDSITELKKLRSLDLRGMNYSHDFQNLWKTKLSWVEIQFDVGCDCGY